MSSHDQGSAPLQRASWKVISMPATGKIQLDIYDRGGQPLLSFDLDTQDFDRLADDVKYAAQLQREGLG